MTDQMAEPEDDQFYDDRYGGVETATSAPTITYVNEHGEQDEEMTALFEGTMGRRARREISSVIEKWSQSLSGYQQTVSLDVFNRTRWGNGANHIHSLMSRCAFAVENDDILSTTADVLEGLMWQKCGFEMIDGDQESVWNQWARDVNLDARLRAFGREEFKCSQFYVGMWWERKVYEVEDDEMEASLDELELERLDREYKDELREHKRMVHQNANNPDFIAPPEPEAPEREDRRGNRRRRKKFPLVVPTAFTIFDPTKVVPVGNMMFGRERFAYVADRGEDGAFGAALSGDVVDDTVLRLIESKYTPTEADKRHCEDIGVDYNRLWLFRKDAVFRHTVTKADYERYAAVRLKPVLDILEMKYHLRASDRATLIGNTNFIVVITKGTDKLPAKPAEIANLQEQARIIARLPVLIGDHRLKVEIVAPTIDHTLSGSRWDVLDARLIHRALKTYAPVNQSGGGSSGGGGTGLSEMSRVISNGLNGARHMILRTLESRVFAEVMKRNEDVPGFDEFPTLSFRPKRISLDFQQDIINAILKLRDRGDISRETMLEELDFDQDTEALRRAAEKVALDKVFASSTPHSSPLANPYGVTQTPPGQPQPPAGPPQPGSNVGPKGQPRTEGGRPPGATDKKPRKKAAPSGG